MHSRSPESRDNLDAAVDLDEELPPKPDWRCLTVRVVAQHQLSGAAMDESGVIVALLAVLHRLKSFGILV